MHVAMTLLGGFQVSVDGEAVRPEAWSRRSAAALVALLALARDRRLHREQVVDALWPDVPPADAWPRLHKAAHFARRALGEATSGVVLRGDVVALLPDDDVEVDAVVLERRARAALEAGDAAAARAVAEAWGGELLPQDLYEPWTEAPRERLRALRVDVLRLAGRWDEVLELDPTDEEAHLAVARRLARAGDVRGALRGLERLDRALRTELGTAPGPEVARLRASLQAAAGRQRHSDRPDGALVGRRDATAAVRRALARARGGRGGTVLVTGPTGVGKSALLALGVRQALEEGWRVGRGAASSLDGPWAYAAVLEALADLCRRHPAILDGLDDAYREEIDHALAGRPLEWTGESAHQRLFVAAAELVRLAASGHGLLLVVDDLHEADEASVRLLHYLARCAVDAPVLLLLSTRASPGAWLPSAVASLLSRGAGTRVELAPLTLEEAGELLAEHHPDLDRATVARLWDVSGGLPYGLLEGAAARAAGDDAPGPAVVGGSLAGLPPTARALVLRLAVLGPEATSDDLLALAEPDAAGAPGDADIDATLDAMILVPTDVGYRFRHEAVREAVLAETPPHRRQALHREVAERLATVGAAPARVARHLLAGGDSAGAAPYVARAVGTLGALGAYPDALDLVDAVLEHTSGAERGTLLARRGDLLMAMGRPEAAAAYRAAIPLVGGLEERLARARLSRSACFQGDYETAAAAIDGLELLGDAADGPILVARGNVAYFTGDAQAAWEAASLARRELSGVDDPWQYVDLVSLQGLIAHNRGDWFGRLRLELRQTLGSPDLAVALFDAHLCVAEFFLYGPEPYAEVVELARGLRDRAERFGSLRAVAFATALIGEAAFLMGDLPLAERELGRAVELHREVASTSGEAHSLQRLADVRLAQGDREEARRLLQRALPLARWSIISMHLLQRIYGTMILAAPDAESARAVVERADATLCDIDRCAFCDIMLAVPATIACADAGDVEEARRRLTESERIARRWEGSAWAAAITEARAHLALAEGDPSGAGRMLAEAAALFDDAGQVVDAARCRSSMQPA